MKLILSTYEEFLNEMPVAEKGDWEEYDKDFGSYSDVGIKSYWKLLTKFKIKGKVFDFLKSKSSNTFILVKLGNDKNYDSDEDRFLEYANLSLSDNTFKNKKYKIVSAVGVLEELRTKSIAMTIYKYLVNVLGYELLSDEIQYFGARRLWSRLSKQIDVIVDIYDIVDDKILEKNVRINHGKLDHEFDKKYWSTDESKARIRFLLRKIK